MQRLLDRNLVMTDLKPENTLYDVYERKATLIDLGGIITVNDKKKFRKRDYVLYFSPYFTAPELKQEKSLKICKLKYKNFIKYFYRYCVSELMETDLASIIKSDQPLSDDHA